MSEYLPDEETVEVKVVLTVKVLKEHPELCSLHCPLICWNWYNGRRAFACVFGHCPERKALDPQHFWSCERPIRWKACCDAVEKANAT